VSARVVYSTTTPNPFARVSAAPKEAKSRPVTTGKCGQCGAIEIVVYPPIGHVNLSAIGESESYPIGYGGCELCS
jgi:hypothetical protein